MEIQQLLINFVKLVYNDNAKQASRILEKLTNKPYHDLLKYVIIKINITKQKVKTLQKLRQKYCDKEQQINRLNAKIAEMKIKKGKQIQSNEQLIKKFSIIQYLNVGQFDQAIRLSSKYQFMKLQNVGKQLLEYKWFKQQAQNQELSIQSKQLKVSWTQNGKKMRNILMNNRIYRRQMNKYLNQALNKLLSKQKPELNLPSDYFRQIIKDSFELVGKQLHALRQFKIIDEEQNIKLLQRASQRLDISLKKEKNERFQQIFERFIVILEESIPSQNFQLQLTLTRAKSQRTNNVQNYEMIKLYGQIKRIIQMNKSLGDQLQLSTSSSYKQSIISCFRNIIANYQGIGDSLKANKQILQDYLQQSSNTLIKIQRINQEIQMIIPNLQNLDISKKSSKNNLEIFTRNFAVLMDQYRKRFIQINRLSTQIQTQQQIQKSAKSLSNTQKLYKIEQNNQKNESEIFLSESQEGIISKLKQQIRQLREANKLLIRKNQDLKNAFQQQYKVKDIHKKYNQSLVSKIKVLEGFRNSIIHTSVFNQDTTFIELQQKYGVLSMQYDQLKRTFDQKQQQFRLFQQNKQEIIKRKQQLHLQQIKKWKQRYNNARQQFEDANHQILKLNQILEEKIILQTKDYSPKKQVIKTPKRQSNQADFVNKSQVQQYTEMLIQERQYRQKWQNLQKQREQEESAFRSKIEEIESIITKLRQQAVQKQKQHIQAQSKSKKDFEEIYKQLVQQKSSLQSKLKDLQIKFITHNDENIKNLHLFALGSIFQQNSYQQRLFLIQNLGNCVGQIKKTRLLYRADHYNKVNFHKYIDKEKHIVVIFKTIYGKLIAGYSQQAFDISGTKRGNGLILSLWARKVFSIKEKKAISYDDYFVIFGNSELRIKALEFKLFSNFGIANGYFDNRGEKVHSILGEDKEREVELSQYQFYALDFDN